MEHPEYKTIEDVGFVDPVVHGALSALATIMVIAISYREPPADIGLIVRILKSTTARPHELHDDANYGIGYEAMIDNVTDNLLSLARHLEKQ